MNISLLNRIIEQLLISINALQRYPFGFNYIWELLQSMVNDEARERFLEIKAQPQPSQQRHLYVEYPMPLEHAVTLL
jgi:hypothetical protein